MTKTEELTLERIRQYIWARYIDNASGVDEIDEDEALRIYERHYAKHPVNEDEECFYYGVLIYEAAFRDEKQRARLLVKAKRILEIYRSISGETDWDVVEDRLEDCCALIEEEGLEEQVVEKPVIAQEIPGMVFVPAGKFLFGAEREEKFLEAFYIDIRPVTNADFSIFVEETRYRPPAIWSEKPDFARPELPVVGVSWMDAWKYSEWAGKELPTEEQWEKAARGPSGQLYPWGDEEPTPERANFRIDEADGGVGIGRIQPVTGYQENVSPFGCRLTVGHVWEWTKTYFDTARKENKEYVVKGGSWADPAEPRYMSTVARLGARWKEKCDLVGFRCSKTVSPEPA